MSAVLWTSAALVALLVLLGLIKIFRSLNSGTFVAGGRSRKTRLAVMDATAIDSQRRLVLVRRDDVEHLLLIGGPSDVVVEQDIRLMAQRRPAPIETSRPAIDLDEPELQYSQPAQRAAPQARPAPELSHPNAGRAAPAAERPVRPAPQIQRPPVDRPAPEPRMVPQAIATPAPAPRAAPQPMPAVRPAPRPPLGSAPGNGRARPASSDSLEETLMNELDLSGDELKSDNTPARAKPAETSLDDEMARLLGELANPRR